MKRPYVLCAAIFAAATTIGGGALAADYELVSTVAVSRHGVRSPIAGHSSLASFAADPWPSWPVAPGYLTPRGAELAKLLGSYYRDYFASQGLIPAQGCPSGAVSVWADVAERTRVTAQSLLDGMFPGCGLAPASSSMPIDPLFHPTRAGVCRIDPAQARKSVLRRAGGDLASLQRKFRAEIAALQGVLKCCQPELCRASGTSAPCSLRNLPSALVAGDNGVRLSGPITIGSTASEVFLLEYADGLPDQQIAWGRASTPQAIQPLLRLHTLDFDLMERTPYLAKRQGSALVDKIWSTLRNSVETNGADGRRLTLLVGHDTNLANIGGMLGLHWSLPSFLPNENSSGRGHALRSVAEPADQGIWGAGQVCLSDARSDAARDATRSCESTGDSCGEKFQVQSQGRRGLPMDRLRQNRRSGPRSRLRRFRTARSITCD